MAFSTSLLKYLIKMWAYWEFPGSPVVRTLHVHCRGSWVQSLVWELSFPQAASCSKKKKSWQIIYTNILFSTVWYFFLKVYKARVTVFCFCFFHPETQQTLNHL